MKIITKLMAVLLLLGVFACMPPDQIEQGPEIIGTDPAKPLKWHDIKKESLSRINSTSPDGYENDDTSGSAKWITVNGSVQEHNFYDDPTDWIKFTAYSGRVYKMESWVYGYGDTKFYLYSSGNLTSHIAYNDDKTGGTYGSFIQWTCPSNGTYYLKVASYNDATGADRAYEIIIIDNTITGDSYEEDDTLVRANRIYSGEVQSHNFTDDPNDFIYFYGSPTNTYRIASTVSGADTVFYLYDANGNQVAYDDDSGPGLASMLYYTPSAYGYYYLKVYSFNGNIGSGRNYTVTITEGNKMKKWTLLVYLCADNNLESAGVGDVAEMEAIGSSNDVNVVLLWDDTNNRHGYYYVSQNNTTLQVDLGEVNMGSETTAKNFINYVTEMYPAEHYFIDFWNHGNGPERSLIRGVCSDDSSNDKLTEVELLNIMVHFQSRINRNVDIIGFDACLMASLEIAYQFRYTADYMVASEELIANPGWDYDFLQPLVNNPNMNARTLAQNVFNAYTDYYQNYTDRTFSVLDLSQAYSVYYALNDFCNAAMASGTPAASFKNKKNDTQYFGKTSGQYTWDLTGYLKNIADSSSFTSTVRTEANEAIAAINNMAIFEWHNGYTGKTINGLSIVLKADTTTYSQLDLCNYGSWDEFLTFCGF